MRDTASNSFEIAFWTLRIIYLYSAQPEVLTIAREDYLTEKLLVSLVDFEENISRFYDEYPVGIRVPESAFRVVKWAMSAVSDFELVLEDGTPRSDDLILNYAFFLLNLHHFTWGLDNGKIINNFTESLGWANMYYNESSSKRQFGEQAVEEYKRRIDSIPGINIDTPHSDTQRGNW